MSTWIHYRCALCAKAVIDPADGAESTIRLHRATGMPAPDGTPAGHPDYADRRVCVVCVKTLAGALLVAVFGEDGTPRFYAQALRPDGTPGLRVALRR